jgi:hypothetical protein
MSRKNSDVVEPLKNDLEMTPAALRFVNDGRYQGAQFGVEALALVTAQLL